MFQKPWSKLDEHNDLADRFPLAVLVWGPAPGDSLEYRKRCEIRDSLNLDGHVAKFSEDLMPKDHEISDPLEEELLQADAANLIVVLYGSRGTQSEIDGLLKHTTIAEKALILIHNDILQKALHSVSGGLWKKLQKFTEIITYTQDEMEACNLVEQVHQWAQKARRAAYIAMVRKKVNNQ